MSNLFHTPKNTRRVSKSKKGPEATKSAKIEPVWEFDEDNDPLTTICQELTEAIVINPSVDMSSYLMLVNKSADDMNKSDACLLILSAVTKRIGMREMSAKFLAESDTVATMFNRLNLNDPSSLDMFSTLIGILAPEVLKSIETAVFASMRRISAKTTASHSISRVTSAMRQATESGLGDDDEFDTATVLARAAPAGRIRFVAQSMIEGLPEDSVLADDSISVRPIKTRKSSVHIGKSGLMLDEEALGMIAKENKGDKFARLRAEYPTIPEPVIAKPKAKKTGLGFDESLSMVTNSPPLKKQDSRVAGSSPPTKKIRSNSEKMSELQTGLLNMQLDEEVQSDDEPSLVF